MAKPQKLTRDLIILVLIVSAAVIAPVAYFSSQVQRDISEQFIDNATDRAVAEFRTMAESMSATLGLVRDWGASGLFAPTDKDALNQLLFPVFDREPMLYGISIADIDGNSYYLQRQEKGWRSSRIEADQTPRKSQVTDWNAEQKQQKVKTEETAYDPRSRPWFAPALAQKEIFWTQPYKFYSSREIGKTASIAYTREKDQKQVVVAFDILLDDIFTEIHKLAPSDNSRVFVLRQDAQLYRPKTVERPPDFQRMTTVQDPLIREAYSNWVSKGQKDNKTISLQHNGATWWAGFRPLENERNTAWICVMVPEQDIVSQTVERRMLLWLFAFSAILLVVGLSIWVFRRHGPKTLPANDKIFDGEDPESEILKMIAEGEGAAVEFKSTLRMNLHTQKPGKEIELAWLKAVAAFLNTEGGTLLLGVNDHGEVTGLEQDVFETEDKCKLHFKNLVAEHLGAEFSKYIDFQIFQVAAHTVGVVRCDRSTEPVFLKANKGEAFYIRNGPSSDELPISKALTYIAGRT